MVATRDGSGNVRLYVNGLLNKTGTLTGSIPSNINFRIGSDVNGFNEQLTGHLYSLKVYNRVLSDQEVAQNYNAIGSRFQYPLANISTYLTLTQAAGLSIYDNTIENTTYLARYSSYASASAFALVNEPII
jgi:hypothetical protein